MDQIENYINNCKTQGFKDADIKEKLVQSGYPKDRIQPYFKKKSHNFLLIMTAIIACVAITLMLFQLANIRLELPQNTVIDTEFYANESLTKNLTHAVALTSEECEEEIDNYKQCIANSYNITYDFDVCGVYIAGQFYDGLNDDLTAKSIITAVDDLPIKRPLELYDYLQTKLAGDKVIFETDNESFDVILYKHPERNYNIFGHVYVQAICPV